MPNANELRYAESYIASASKYGMLRSTADRSVWLWAAIPWTVPLTDGANDYKRGESARQFQNFFDGLAGMVSVGAVKHRDINEGSYREWHILSGAMPVAYRTSPLMRGTDLGRWQNDMYADYTTQKQCAYVGVRLNAGGGMFGRDERLDIVSKALYGYDNLVYNIKEGVPRFEEFLPDMGRVALIMKSAGFTPFCEMSPGTLARHVGRMKSWWVSEGNSDALPVIADRDHLHLFPDTTTCTAAKIMYNDKIPCDQWNIRGEFPATICAVKSSDFAQTEIASATSQWLATLMQVRPIGANAVGVSIRGKVEPAAITADQIRRNRNAIEDAIRDREKHGREATGAMSDQRERLEYKQAIYRTPDMPPTLIDLSVTALVAGRKQAALDALSVVPYVEFVAMNTPAEQLFGFQSMQACSDKRLTPFELQWSSTCVAGAGINSFDKAGDPSGALLGFGEKNRQPVYLGTTVAQDEDRAPSFAIVGGTGSGKEISLSTPVPMPPQKRFPTGSIIPLGELREGDKMYWRGGGTCTLRKLHPIVDKDVYEVELSDGQKIHAGGDHLWTASNRADRRRRTRDKHLRSLECRRAVTETAQRLADMAGTIPEGETMDARGIARLVAPVAGEWMPSRDREKWVLQSLHMMDFTGEMQRIETVCKAMPPRTVRVNRPRYDAVDALTLLRDLYRLPTAHGGQRWDKVRAERADRLDEILRDPPETPVSVKDIVKLMGDLAPGRNGLREALSMLEPASLWDEETREIPERTQPVGRLVFDARGAVRALALRLVQRYAGEEPDDGRWYDEQVVSTREMLVAGVRTKTGHTNWSIHAPEPLDLPEMDLPIDPWMLGAWLADGSSTSDEFASDPNNGDLDYLQERIERLGFDCTRKEGKPAIKVRGWLPLLRENHLYGDKHIPEQYFHASIRQRLELVRGLLDQDGTINPNGSIEFTQSLDHKPIVEGLVRLLRSLGVIVHEPVRSKAGYRLDGERHETQDRLRVTFTTSLPVFSLPRKRNLLPKETRKTQEWLYVTRITRIPDEPCRCLTVDSPDHTFLVAGYVPTHNTMALLSLCFQWARIVTRDGLLTPVIVVDPKENSDFSDPVKRRGGRVISIDSDVSNGQFDPCRVLQNEEEAKEMACTMLANIFYPHGDSRTETDLNAMLDYGLKHGAKCCGTALRMAKDAYLAAKAQGKRIRTLDEGVVKAWDMVDKQLESNQFLRIIIGTDDDVPPLKASEGLTLIKAGARSLVPAEGSENTVNGRIQRWVLRMIVLGAGSSVRGRDGVVALDEAWVALGEGSAQVIAQWMRLARSQRFLPVLASQKVQEFSDAGLEGGFSRALILSMEDTDESDGAVSPAKATLRLFQMTGDDPQILERMRTKPKMENGEPNWRSLQRLRIPVDPDRPEGKERTIRGAVAYFKDGSNAPVPVEITIPAPVLAEISTNAKDNDENRRKARQHARATAGRTPDAQTTRPARTNPRQKETQPWQ